MLIPLDSLITKYSVVPAGVIHVGAHAAEEASNYQQCGFKQVIWIEGNPELIPSLKNKLEKFPSQKVYQALIDIEEKETVFNLTSDPQSSSIYKLKEHALQYPSVKPEKEIVCVTQRLDSFLSENKIKNSDYTFLNLDIQGSELNALKSLGDQVHSFKFIYTEVQLTELYAGSPNLNEMDTYLFSKGFVRSEMSLKYRSWGDAFYVKKSEPSKFYCFLKLMQSKFLVKSWPLRKFLFRIIDQINYVVQHKLLKKPL